MTADKIADLAQELYEKDGHSGNIYKKAPIHMLRFYEYKAQEVVEGGEHNVKDHYSLSSRNYISELLK